jgi:ABC-type lipoprotein release transport system permease subunit
MRAQDSSNGLVFTAIDDGSGTSMQYLELPIATPALLAGARPDSVDALGYLTGATLDGGVGRISIVGTLPFVPEAGPSAVLVDLNLALRTTSSLNPGAIASVWLRTDDPARERRVLTALRAAGIGVLGRHTTTQAQTSFAHSAPGWSAQFALVVGVLAELLALGLLVLLVLTSRRVRQRDLAALRLSGLPAKMTRRSTALELLILVVIGVVVGAGAGVAGAALSLPAIPIFTVTATVPLPLTYGLRALWLVGVVLGSLVLLVPTAAALGSWIAGRARPEQAVVEAL